MRISERTQQPQEGRLMRRRAFVAFAAAAALLNLPGLTGCRSAGTPPTANGAAPKTMTVVRIGHQRGDSLHLLKARGTLEKRLSAQGVTVEWAMFPAGPQLLEALGGGAVAFGATGETPPIFAQAAGSDMVYVANIPLAGDYVNSQALIVPPGSTARSVADLKGKRIAFQKGSSAHNFLIQVLQHAGLSPRDIQPVYLAPPDARPAFDSGRVDAWVVWDPFLASAERTAGVRVLVNGEQVVTPGNFYLSSRRFTHAHPEIVKAIVAEVRQTTVWAQQHRDEADQLLSRASGIDLETTRQLGQRRPRLGLEPMTSEVVRKQQTIADSFYRERIVPKRVNIAEALLTAEEYRDLLAEISAGADRSLGRN